MTPSPATMEPPRASIPRQASPGWILGLVLLVTALASLRTGAADANAPAAKPARGYAYVHDQAPEIPWSMHVVKVQLRHPDLEIHSALGRRDGFAMAVVSEIARTIPPAVGTPVAAINGDFYHNSDHYRGRPRDLQICRGELVSSPSGHACFWLDPDGNPHMTNLQSRLRVVWPGGFSVPIGLNEERNSDSAVLYTAAVGNTTHAPAGLALVLERGSSSRWLPLAAGETYSARVRESSEDPDTPVTADTMVVSFGPRLVQKLPAVLPGMTLQVITETFPNLTGVTTAIGGGPTLARNGQAMEWTGLQARQPRSALGFNRDTLFLVEVDGRQGNLSLGMSFPELAAYMLKLGCTDALNLDGGGSATLWVLGNVMNSPSEGRERPAANGLVVVEKPRHKSAP